MKKIHAVILLLGTFVPVMTPLSLYAEKDIVEKALSEVRDVKQDMFSRHSSVLGELPGPSGLAAAQMRTRPIPSPQPGGPGVVNFTNKQKSEYSKLYKLNVMF